MDLINRLPRRVRHETRFRLLTVARVERLTPLMVRVVLTGDLAGFTTQGYDDHVRAFFFAPGQEPVVPFMSPEGAVFPPGVERPQSRDYTPRRYDPVANTLDIDFVLHGEGPASSWAARVAEGDTLLIGGPRGSMLIPDAFDWYLLAGDETALPAIARRLEEMPEGRRVLAFLEVADEAEEQVLPTRADATITWVHRNGAPAGTTTLLRDALAAQDFPAGVPFVFVAGEANQSRAIRRYLAEARGLSEDYLKAAGYWLLGQADAHEPH